jgi:hypothetical protein
MGGDEIMIEEIVINLVSMVFGVTVGTYLGAKIMKHELRKEVTRYILNDLPHALADEKFKQKTRELTRTAIREFWNTIIEELGVEQK